jgi:calcineurin-like phosphoesterase
MRILFLGDVVGISCCSKIMNNLLDQIKKNKIDFVVVNAENADEKWSRSYKRNLQRFF